MMKLSVAIRLGAMLRPSAKTIFNETGTCALGAALEAHIGEVRLKSLAEQNAGTNAICDLYHFLRERTQHPITRADMYKWEILVALNDRANWTRNQIADYVESIEPQDILDPLPQAQGEEVGRR